ncbi:MAG: carboxypeptidase-like regulatory domain-containing protein [Minisyncoccia bacterium]
MQRPRGERGSTLLDAVVGTALMLTVFVGIVGAFRLTVMAVSNNKARAGAIALANERLEYIRSLPYNSIGTVGGIPAGLIAQSETIVLNDVTYTRRTFVSYEDDPNDGTGGADSNGVIIDYKAAKSSVSWTVRGNVHTLTLVSRVSPPGIETSIPGGTLSFNVLDAALVPVSSAQIRIVNTTLNPAIDMTTYTDLAGLASVIGAPPGSGYQISVSKSGYSNAQTYGTTATNTNPIPAHLGVALNQTTAATFAIDVTSSKTIEVYTPVTYATTTENFSDNSGIASSDATTVSGGVVRLTPDSEGAYPASGTLMSTTVSTSTLFAWQNFSFDDSRPAGTSIFYRVYNGSGTSLVPDSQIPGNSGGLTVSPINLSNVSTSTFSSLAIQAVLAGDITSTPSIDSWAVAFAAGPHLLPNVNLTMTGAKTIGTTAGGALVYKYQNSSLSSGASGRVTIPGLEWDSYTVALNAPAYSVSSACSSQPESLSPGSTQLTRLFVSPATANSLLVDVRDGAGGGIPNASVRLSRGAYDTTLSADSCGQSFFSGISAGSVGGGNAYTLDVTAAGFQAYSSNGVNVSGTSRTSVILNN